MHTWWLWVLMPSEAEAREQAEASRPFGQPLACSPSGCLVVRNVRRGKVERHAKVAGQRSAGLGGGSARRGATAFVNGCQVAFTVWAVQDRNQQHEPIVHGIAVPEGLDRSYTARESCGTGCERRDIEGIGRRALHLVAKHLVSPVDHPLCLMQAQPQRAQGLPHGPDCRQASVVQHVCVDLSAGPFLQVGPPVAHWATSWDLKAGVIGAKVRQPAVRLRGSLARGDTLDRHGWHPMVTADESASTLSSPRRSRAAGAGRRTRGELSNDGSSMVVGADTPAAASGLCRVPRGVPSGARGTAEALVKHKSVLPRNRL